MDSDLAKKDNSRLWDSFDNTFNDMDKLFERYSPSICGDYPWGADFVQVVESLNVFNPKVDSYEKDGKFFITCELPGVKKEDVTVSIDNNILTISGSKINEVNTEVNGVTHKERSYGSFSRNFTLNNFDPEKIETNFKNGVLTVSMPVEAKKEAKKIEIKEST